MNRHTITASALCASLATLAAGAAAQSSTEAPPPAAPARPAQATPQTRTPAAAAAPAAASAPAAGNSQRVDVTGGRPSDTEERRNATASKIVIGRQEIEQFGDSNTLEILKRLPGITMPGAPGRGGPPPLRRRG